MREFSDDPAWTKMWPFLFQDEQSQWFAYLRDNSTPDPKSFTSPSFNVEEWFGTATINKDAFRSFIVRLLHDKSPCGRILGGPGSYWLDQRLSIHRAYGYTVAAPSGLEIADKAFRTCDFYAWLLSNRIEGAPIFQLYWPETERDGALSALEKMLQKTGTRLKTRPFQER